jgi:tetratricopeptide (TPR) repeat protein
MAARQLAVQLGRPGAAAYAAAALAVVRLYQTRFEEAVEHSEGALAGLESVRDRLRVMRVQAHALIALGRREGARRCLERFRVAALKTEDPWWDAQYLSLDASWSSEFTNLQETTVAFEEAVRALRQTGDLRGAALAQGNLAIKHHNAGSPDEAERLYREAIDTLESVGEVRFLASNLMNLGNLIARARPAEGRRVHNRAERLFRQMGNQAGLASLYGNRAVSAHQDGRLEKADAEYQCAVEMARAACSDHLPVFLVSWASLKRERNELERAGALMSEGMRLLPTGEVSYVNALAERALIEQASSDDGQASMTAALERVRELGRDRAAWLLACDGLFRLAGGDVSGAGERLTEARDLDPTQRRVVQLRAALESIQV